MKGIILAGGLGKRLYPLTKDTNKQLLPINNKAMIMYPLSTLILAEITDILIITTKESLDKFKNLLGDGSKYDIKISYAIQKKPNGLGEAFLIGEEFIGNDTVALILGDNIFYKEGFKELLLKAKNNALDNNATIFAHKTNHPKEFGVMEFDENNKVISIEEKPNNPKSNYCVTGLYFYDNRVVEFAKTIKPSKRGELEITDINNMYLKASSLTVEILDEDTMWFDTGTIEDINRANKELKGIDERIL